MACLQETTAAYRTAVAPQFCIRIGTLLLAQRSAESCPPR
jgi:hypothetical protein